MRRTLPALAGILLAVALATGCGGPEPIPEGTVRVRFWHAMSGPLAKALHHLVDRFHRDHPGIRIEPVFQGGYAQLSQKINLALMDGSPPDMAQMYEAMIAFCNRSGETLLPLDGFIAADPELRFDDVFGPFRDTITQGGKVYSLPPTKSFPVLYLNLDMLEAAGFTRAPETWDELASMGRTLTRDLDGDGRTDQWGWAFVNDPWVFQCMVLQNGGSLLTAEGKSAMGSEAARSALAYTLDSVMGPRPFAYRTTGFDHQLDFADGKVAMIIGSSVSRTFMADQITFRLGAAPLPQGKVKASIMAGPNIAIFKGIPEPRQKAAFEFLKFFTSTNATLYWGIATNYIPIRRSAVESEAYRRRVEADPGFAAGIRQMDWAVSEPPLPAWYECRQILSSLMQKVFHEPAAMDRVLGEAVADMDRVLAEDRRRSRQTVDGKG